MVHYVSFNFFRKYCHEMHQSSLITVLYKCQGNPTRTSELCSGLMAGVTWKLFNTSLNMIVICKASKKCHIRFHTISNTMFFFIHNLLRISVNCCCFSLTVICMFLSGPEDSMHCFCSGKGSSSPTQAISLVLILFWSSFFLTLENPFSFLQLSRGQHCSNTNSSKEF